VNAFTLAITLEWLRLLVVCTWPIGSKFEDLRSTI
jgi:hypothetical protein